MLYQTFQLVAELTAKVELNRREASIPGSTLQAGPVLFGKDEVQAAAQFQKVNSTKSYFNGANSCLHLLGKIPSPHPSFKVVVVEKVTRSSGPLSRARKAQAEAGSLTPLAGRASPGKEAQGQRLL